MNTTAPVAAPELVAVDYIERYRSLCRYRDHINKLNEPLEEKLAKLNAEIEAKQLAAADVAAEIDRVRGGAEWVKLKGEIKFIAAGLGRIPHEE